MMNDQEAWIPLGAAALLVCLGAFVASGPANAQGNKGAALGAVQPIASSNNASACTSACQASYAQCYKASGSNRKVCEAQLQQCLSTCIRAR